MTRLTRRGLLASMAAGAALAPFLPLLPSHAAGGAYPCRLIVFKTPHGIAYDNWDPSGSGSNWSLSPILQPLSDFKSKMVVITGLNSEAAKSGPGKDHNRASSTYLTGTELTSSEKPGGASIDQIVGQHYASETRFPSLETSVISNSRGFISAGPEAGIAPERNPAEVYDRLFGDIGGNEEEILRLRARRRSVLGLVRGDLDRLRGTIGTDDRDKLDRHLEAVARIEGNLDTLGELPGSCTLPVAPTGIDSSSAADYPDIGRAHMDLIVSAVSCGLTRVASLQWAGGQTVLAHVGMSAPQHDVCHSGNRPNRPLFAELTATSVNFAEQLAYLCGALDAIPEGDGSVLDNTLVMWCTEMSNGGHDWDDMPLTIVGGGNMGLVGDRVHRFSGRALNDWLLTVAQLMGVPLDSIGNPAYVQGPLSGLT